MIFSRADANNETMGVRMQKSGGRFEKYGDGGVWLPYKLDIIMVAPLYIYLLVSSISYIKLISYTYATDRPVYYVGLGEWVRLFNTFTHATEQFWYHAMVPTDMVKQRQSHIYASRYLMSSLKPVPSCKQQSEQSSNNRLNFIRTYLYNRILGNIL